MGSQSYLLPDSGKREGFGSGSVRDSREGKGRYDLITPFALKRISQHYENGARKYADRNWEKGQPIMRYFDSASRHLQTWLMDLLLGKPHAEDHLAAAAWNIMAMIDHEERIQAGVLDPKIDDRPGPVGGGADVRTREYEVESPNKVLASGGRVIFRRHDTTAGHESCEPSPGVLSCRFDA